VFSGQLQSSIECQKCQYVSSTFDVFMDLSIPVSDGTSNYISLDECLNGFFKEELLETPYECCKCKSKSSASKKLYISRYPPVLVLHLKRFETERKLNHPVSFPLLDLNLKEFQSPFLETFGLNYNLVAVSNHFGSLLGGHYTARVKNWIDDNWCDRNDSTVNSLSNKENFDDNSAAYILFYENIP
jgi:ubiquitin carboxyl-terminal hydrolase 2/21